MDKTKKLALMAALTAIALIVFIIETQIPLPIPIPGAKLGLANTVTLFALFFKKKTKQVFTTADAFMILLCRIMLGAAFTGRFIALLYSIAGGFLSFAALVLMRRLVTDKQIWACGVISAIFHNIGQILAAMAITRSPAIAAYLPMLTITGVATGIITGLVAQIILGRLRHE